MVFLCIYYGPPPLCLLFQNSCSTLLVIRVFQNILWKLVKFHFGVYIVLEIRGPSKKKPSFLFKTFIDKLTT
jgi:hypothetical protein